MGLWWFLIFCVALTPFIMIGAGRMMWKHYPSEINSIIGYRTSRSMKNMDTWKFANEYCGKLWWKLGWIILIPSLLSMVPFMSSNEETIGTIVTIVITIHCIILIAAIFPTEMALKRTFTKDGIRKSS